VYGKLKRSTTFNATQAPHRPLLGEGGDGDVRRTRCYVRRNLHTTVVKPPKAARRLLQAAQPLVSNKYFLLSLPPTTYYPYLNTYIDLLSYSLSDVRKIR